MLTFHSECLTKQSDHDELHQFNNGDSDKDAHGGNSVGSKRDIKEQKVLLTKGLAAHETALLYRKIGSSTTIAFKKKKRHSFAGKKKQQQFQEQPSHTLLSYIKLLERLSIFYTLEIYTRTRHYY
jgi:hypothetical protein